LSPFIFPRPLVYAHRGGAALRPENTLAAFDHGLALGADGLEFDVHLSRDGVVVVHHDSVLERTTNGRGPVAALSAAELGALDAGYTFVPDGADGFPYRGQGLGIPTFEAVVARYPGVPFIIELKSRQEELARRTVEVLQAGAAADRVAVASFYGSAVRKVRRLDPRIVTGAAREEIRWALYRSWIGWPLRETAYQEFHVPERSGRTAIVTPAFIRHAHRAGLPVKVWTVDEPSDLDRLLNWGVDGVISDRPDLAVAAVRRCGNL